MIFAIATHPDEHSEHVLAAGEFHTNALADTGYFGGLQSVSFPGATLLWDGGSSHALHTVSPLGAHLLRGGYTAEEDCWEGDEHSTELPHAWGEFGAVKVTAQGAGTEARAFNDPAASWPLYYGRRGRMAAVSNDAQFVAILLGETQLSSQGVYEVLTYSHAVGHGTTIEGVSRSFPGEQIILTGSPTGVPQLRIERTATYRYGTVGTTTQKTYESLRSSVAKVAAIQRRFPESTIQISGGLDSRLTAAVLATSFPERPTAVTLDLSDELEMEVAAEVSATLGFPHRVATLGEIDSSAMRTGWLLTGGQVSVYAAAGNILSYETANSGASPEVTILGGWPGDCLIGSYVPLLPTMSSQLLTIPVVRDWASKRGYKWAEIGVTVSGRRARQIARRALANLRRRLVNSSGRTAAQKISYWGMFSRQPAFSYVSPALLTSHVLAVTPLLARPYIEELMQLQSHQIIGKNFYRQMIIRALPNLAGIPYSTTGEPITTAEVKPKWRVASRGELYQLFPDRLQWLVRRLRPQGPYNPTSVEAEFWADMFDREGADGLIELPDLTIDARSTKHLHVRSVSLGLKWTQQYLDDARKALRGRATTSLRTPPLAS